MNAPTNAPALTTPFQTPLRFQMRGGVTPSSAASCNPTMVSHDAANQAPHRGKWKAFRIDASETFLTPPPPLSVVHGLTLLVERLFPRLTLTGYSHQGLLNQPTTRGALSRSPPSTAVKPFGRRTQHRTWARSHGRFGLRDWTRGASYWQRYRSGCAEPNPLRASGCAALHRTTLIMPVWALGECYAAP